MSDEIEAAPPFMRGVFSLYETPDGGIHLAFRAEDQDEDQHVQIPAMLVGLARETAESGRLPGPMDLFKISRKKRGN